VVRRRAARKRSFHHGNHLAARPILSPPSTGFTCARPIRSSRLSPPSGTGPRSPAGRGHAPRDWPWRSSSSRPPRTAGARSTVHTSLRSSGPALASRPARSSNDPRNTANPTPPKRSSSTGIDNCSARWPWRSGRSAWPRSVSSNVRAVIRYTRLFNQNVPKAPSPTNPARSAARVVETALSRASSPPGRRPAQRRYALPPQPHEPGQEQHCPDNGQDLTIG
jgi:hypothetical protein